VHSNLTKQIRTVFGYCNAKKKHFIDFNDPPYQQLINSATKYYGKIWSYDQFDDRFSEYLGKLIGTNISDKQIELIITDIGNFLNSNMEEVFIFAPLKGAWIEKTFAIGNISIVKTIDSNMGVVPASLPRSQVISEIHHLTGIDKIRISKALSTISHSRAPDFLTCPLLILKRFGQYDEIYNISNTNFLLEYYNVFLRVMALGNSVQKTNKHTKWVDAEHYFCLDKQHNYHHYPLRGTLSLDFDFSFLAQKNNPQILQSIINLFETQQYNSLQVLYFRAMKFLSNSLKGTDNSKEDISFRILNILIAAESFLVFTTRGEKKNKLAHILVDYLNIPEPDRSKFISSIKEVYTDRSGLVHAGIQNMGKYILNYSTNSLESESLIVLQDLVSQVFLTFPDQYAKIAKTTTQEKYLDLWKETVLKFVPKTEYTFYQKKILDLIFLLRKVGRLGNDV
jgi:hypothetical protein